MKSNTITLLSGASMASSVTSNPLALDQMIGFAAQAVWVGTPTGTLKLQASSDSPVAQTQVSNGGPDSITNWSDIANSSYSIAGSAGNYMWNVTDCFFRYVRVIYTRSGSTGSLSCSVSIKGV